MLSRSLFVLSLLLILSEGAEPAAPTPSRPVAMAVAGGDDDDLDELEVQRHRLQTSAGELRARVS